MIISALALSYGGAAHAARKATSEKNALHSNEGCGSLSKKCCARLPQPPVFSEPYGDILAGENCTCCFENKVDIRFEEEVKSFIEHVVGRCFHGRLDILVNCASIYWAGSFAQATGDDLLHILNNNVAAYHRVTHYALPYMRHNNETRVISFGSLAAYAVARAFGGYGIAKAAIPKWNDAMQIEEMFNKAQ